MKTEKANVADLMLDPSNVRTHSAVNLAAIKASLAKFGQQKPIVVDAKGIVIAGNGQLMAAKQLGWSTIQIVRSELTGSEATAYAIADNRTAELAEWDDDALAQQLAALKIDDESLLQACGFDDNDLANKIGSALAPADDRYASTIQAPTYTPTGARPELSELFNKERYAALSKRIAEAKDIDAETKAFLTAAATRHIVFDFQQIAEFYAHASDDVQRLMEESALVIIDMDAAIANGYVRMTQEILDLVDSDTDKDEIE